MAGEGRRARWGMEYDAKRRAALDGSGLQRFTDLFSKDLAYPTGGNLAETDSREMFEFDHEIRPA